MWFSDEAIEGWRAAPRTTPGGQPWYSPLAILTALTLRAVFRLALRQTEGLIGSVLHLLRLALAVPDHTTLCRRAETLEVPRPRPRREGEAVQAWQAEPRTTRGGQPDYSPLAILTALTLRAVFRLPFRQTEGLIGSVIGLLGLDLAVPDHTTLSAR